MQQCQQIIWLNVISREANKGGVFVRALKGPERPLLLLLLPLLGPGAGAGAAAVPNVDVSKAAALEQQLLI